MIKTFFRLVPALCLLLAACTSTKPVVQKKDPGLYLDAHELTVKIQDGWLTAKTISIGDYSTSSRTNGVAANTPAKQFRNVSDAFYFTVKATDVQMPVQVLSTPRITFSNRPMPEPLDALAGDVPLWYFHIGATVLEPLKSWELILKRSISFLELNENKPAGVLRSASDEIRVTAHNRFGIRNSYENTCYEFQLRGVPVAAVMTGDKPRAWIHPKADAALQQTLVAAMLAIVFKG